jgi:hypothetical protein
LFPPIPGVHVIGIGHKARHGKDTFARALIEARPDLVQRFAFADALKALARVRHGMTRKDAPLLQRLGLEAREHDVEVWLRAVYWAIEDARPAIAVITDVRFENEAEFVRGMGGTLVRVSRVSEDGVPYVDPSRPATHVSETALDGYTDWHHVIVASSPESGARARPPSAPVGAAGACGVTTAFLRAFVYVSLTAANVAQIAHRNYAGAVVYGTAISLLWTFNVGGASRGGVWWKCCYAAGAGCGTAFGMWLGG